VSVTIELFTFLERSKERIVALLEEELTKRKPTLDRAPGEPLEPLLLLVIEGYSDMLITGESDTLDKLFGALSRVLAAKGAAFSDIFEIPLTLGTIIRRLMVEEYEELDMEDKLADFNEKVDQTESVAIKAACRFLDVFDGQLKSRVETHNRYLERIGASSGLDLTSFRIAAVAE
jgi:hypothetical protein